MRLEVVFFVKKKSRIRKELYKKEAVYNFLKEKDDLKDCVEEYW